MQETGSQTDRHTDTYLKKIKIDVITVKKERGKRIRVCVFLGNEGEIWGVVGCGGGGCKRYKQSEAHPPKSLLWSPKPETIYKQKVFREEKVKLERIRYQIKKG